MNLLTKIKVYGGAAIAGVIGLLYWLLGQRTKQRDQQRQRADTAEVSHKATQTKAKLDSSVVEAGAESRRESAKLQEEENAKPIDERRKSGREFGTSGRLRE